MDVKNGDNMPVLRISEVSRRTGVPVPTIRGWERRHGFPVPTRTESGYRLYSEADVRGVAQLRELIDTGMAVSQAVEVMRAREADASSGALQPRESNAGGAGSDGVAPADMATQLAAALQAFDSARGHELLDRAFSLFGVTAAICDVALVAVRTIGELWESGDATIAQEHFASNLIRGRMWGLARGWDQGVGRRIVLAVTGGDQHDLPLLALGVLLRERGWRITWIGADTPASVLLDVAQRMRPAIVLVSMTARRPKAADADELRAIVGAGIQLFIAGPRAHESLADELGAVHIGGGPFDVADVLDSSVR